MEGTIDQNRLIALLLEEKLINKRQVKDALSEQEKSHKPLAQILLDLKLVTPGVLSELQARVMGMEHVKISDLRMDSEVLKLLPKRYALEHRAIPVGLSGNTLTVAMENPQDVLAIDEIKMLTGYNVRAVVCSPKDIEFGLQQYPAEDEGIITAGPPISKTRHALQTLLFFFLLLLPLGIVYYVAAYVSNDFNYWLLGNNDITNIITVLIIWMFYAVILFYIFGLIFEQPAPRKDRKSSSE